METICKFHHVKTEFFESEVLGGGRNPRAPLVRKMGFCLHPQGRDIMRCWESGNDMPCKGDPKACVISPEAPFSQG